MSCTTRNACADPRPGKRFPLSTLQNMPRRLTQKWPVWSVIPKPRRPGHGKNIHGDCRQCHLPYHDEKVAHDLHALVACGSCHLQGTQPERDPKSKHVIWKRTLKPGQVSRVHEMAIQDKDASCRHCHIPDNRIGAASMILPAKSIICMPCHAGTFSVGDTTTILTLIAFIAGMVMVFSYVLTGASFRFFQPARWSDQSSFLKEDRRHSQSAVPRCPASKTALQAIAETVVDSQPDFLSLRISVCLGNHRPCRISLEARMDLGLADAEQEQPCHSLSV